MSPTITHMFHDPLLHMIAMLLLSVLLGGVIGWDRERHERPAGLRTHILVCLGSTLITLVSVGDRMGGARIAAQIVTGVGFLGAGTIIREGNGAVRGLTTAASLWAVAGIGIAIGYGGIYAELATVATFIGLLVLTILDRFDGYLGRHRKRQSLALIFSTGPQPLENLRVILDSLHNVGARTRDLRFDNAPSGQIVHMNISLTKRCNRDQVSKTLTANKDVVQFNWED